MTEQPIKKIRARALRKEENEGVRLQLWVEPYHVEWIEAKSKRAGLNRSLFMREILDDLIKRNPG